MKKTPILLITCLFVITNAIPAQSLFRSPQASDGEIVPFFVFSNLLLVRAQADDQDGYFILDTGAPGLILNRKYFRAGGNDRTDQVMAIGINGEVDKVLQKEVRLQLGNKLWKDVYASIYDLQYLEEAKGIRIIGLLGSSLFRNLELTIDFTSSELILTALDKNGERNGGRYDYRFPDVTVPFRQKGHMPCIEADIGGHTLQFGIDSGAGIGLIINAKQSELSPFVEPGDSIRIRGLDQSISWAPTVRLKELTIANLSYAYLKIAFANLSQINRHFAGMSLDGLLGLDLLSQHKTTINFKKKEIYIWLPEGEHPQLVLNKPGNDRNIRN